jgi:hypothetical protein
MEPIDRAVYIAELHLRSFLEASGNSSLQVMNFSNRETAESGDKEPRPRAPGLL